MNYEIKIEQTPGIFTEAAHPAMLDSFWIQVSKRLLGWLWLA